MLPGETLFITFRLAGSLTRATGQQLQAQLQAALAAARAPDLTPEAQQTAHRRAQKHFFAKFDAELDKVSVGQTYLEKEKLAEIVAGELMMLEETGLRVLAFALLPNHVHAVLHLPAGSGLAMYKSLQLLHQRTAAQCARKLRLPVGTDFWQPGFHELPVLDEAELSRIIVYIQTHAARLRLPERYHDWPYRYAARRT